VEEEVEEEEEEDANALTWRSRSTSSFSAPGTGPLIADKKRLQLKEDEKRLQFM
jgi:hypothetical protein